MCIGSSPRLRCPRQAHSPRSPVFACGSLLAFSEQSFTSLDLKIHREDGSVRVKLRPHSRLGAPRDQDRLFALHLSPPCWRHPIAPFSATTNRVDYERGLQRSGHGLERRHPRTQAASSSSRGRFTRRRARNSWTRRALELMRLVIFAVLHQVLFAPPARGCTA